MSKENFEQSLKHLQEMSEKIKSPDTSLEEAVKCYEEGMKHYNTCSKILDNASQKIETFQRREVIEQ